MARTHPQTDKPTRESRDREGNRGGRNGYVTPERLERWALFYLNRYATSVANLRAVLRRRVVRQGEKSAEDQSVKAAPWIEDLLEKLVEGQYLDDRRYAQGLIRRLRERGGSTRRVRAGLLSKGVQAALADELLNTHDDSEDLAAACRFARRRRLGVFRAEPALRSERRERDLAALSRAGFSYPVASRVIDANDRSALDAWLTES